MGVNGGKIVSADQIDASKLFEGEVRDEATRLHAAYLDELPEVPVWTIGYGHTTQNIEIHGVLDGEEYHGTDVVKGLLIDDEEADRLLKIRMGRNAQIVREAVQVELTQAQFDAFADMAHNLGSAPFRKGSDLLAALNGGMDDRGIRIGPADYNRANDEIVAWRKAGGRASRGVWRRRLINALMAQGLPWQWLWYSSKVGLETSLAEAERMAGDYEDRDMSTLPVDTTYSKIIATVEKQVEQAREAEAVSTKTKAPSAYTRQAAQVHYKIDPSAGLKPLEESSRVAGYVWQQVGIAGMRVAVAGGVPAASVAANDPQLQNAVIALWVLGGTAAMSGAGYLYGTLKRKYGEKSASQGLY